MFGKLISDRDNQLTRRYWLHCKTYWILDKLSLPLISSPTTWPNGEVNMGSQNTTIHIHNFFGFTKFRNHNLHIQVFENLLYPLSYVKEK